MQILSGEVCLSLSGHSCPPFAPRQLALIALVARHRVPFQHSHCSPTLLEIDKHSDVCANMLPLKSKQTQNGHDIYCSETLIRVVSGLLVSGLGLRSGLKGCGLGARGWVGKVEQKKDAQFC